MTPVRRATPAATGDTGTTGSTGDTGSGVLADLVPSADQPRAGSERAPSADRRHRGRDPEPASTCSTTSWASDEEDTQKIPDHSKPASGRCGHHGDRDRRRLLLVQREHRSAIRTDLPDQCRASFRLQPGRRQRSPDRRRPRRRDRHGHGPSSSRTGGAVARLDLKLDKSVQPIPEDTTVTVRQRSALGLKYLLLTPGDSDQGLDRRAATFRSVRPSRNRWTRTSSSTCSSPKSARRFRRTWPSTAGMFAVRGADINRTAWRAAAAAQKGRAGHPQPGIGRDRPQGIHSRR